MLGDESGRVKGLECLRMELGEPDDSGRRRPVPVAGSEFEFETDIVAFAIGTNANPIIGQTCKLKLNKRGYIETDDNLATSVAGVYAGGDIVTGAATLRDNREVILKQANRELHGPDVFFQELHR